MSPLLLPLETMPGWPVSPDPGLQILVPTLLIPGSIALVIMLFGMGRTWLKRGVPAPTPLPEEHLEILPSNEQLKARRELVHQAMMNNEARADLPVRQVKSDPETNHP